MASEYVYRAYGRDGKVEAGAIEAISEAAAAAMLTRRGLSVFEIRPEAASGKSWLERDIFAADKIKPSHQEEFLRLLAALLGARLPVDQALQSIGGEDLKSPLSLLSARLLERVQSGQALSDAVAAEEKNTLPVSWPALMAAGEASGQLAEVLGEMAVAQKRRNRISSEIRSALIYPVLLGVLAIVTVTFIIVFLLPALQPLIEETGGDLPAPVAGLMAMSGHISSHPLLWTLGFIVLGFGVFRISSQPAVRTVAGRLGLRLPIVGRLIRQLNAARISGTMGLLLSNRVEPLHAITITKSTVSHAAYAQLLTDLHAHLQNGGRLSEGLKADGLMPAQVINLVTAGERAGETASMLKEASAIMQTSSKQSLDRLVSLLTPALTLILGLVIGGIVLSVMSTLLSVNNAAF